MKTRPWKFVDLTRNAPWLAALFERVIWRQKTVFNSTGSPRFQKLYTMTKLTFLFWISSRISLLISCRFYANFYATKHRRPWPAWFLFSALLAEETSANREDFYESQGVILLSKWAHRQMLFSLFTLVIRGFFSLKNICDKIDFHVPRQTCWCKRLSCMLV